MKTQNKSILLGIVLFIFAFEAQGAIYKWTDAQGNVQYSQMPPATQTSTEIKPPPPPSSTAEKERQRFEDLEKKFEKTQEDIAAAKAKEEQAKQDARKNEINCARSKTHLENLLSKVRVRLQNARSQQDLLTESERDIEIEKTKENIEKFCSPSPPNSSLGRILQHYAHLY